MQLTITGYSTALFSTWYFIEELGLLFDAGEGLTSSLLQKSRKINNVFISHADRDHLTGLFQFNQLNARQDFPVIHYPKDSGSFPAIELFSKKFDPHVSGTVWKPIKEGDNIWIKDDIYVEALRNNHVSAPIEISKSLSFKVIQIKQKLRPELISLPAEEIKKVILEKGKDNTTMQIQTNLISYSGDTPVEDSERWNNSKILIHEATFLGGDEDSKVQAHGNRHSTLDEVMEMASRINLGSLILGHFSSRYSHEQIDKKIRFLSENYSINFPVFRVLPGQTVYDIQKQKPMNN